MLWPLLPSSSRQHFKCKMHAMERGSGDFDHNRQQKVVSRFQPTEGAQVVGSLSLNADAKSPNHKHRQWASHLVVNQEARSP